MASIIDQTFDICSTYAPYYCLGVRYQVTYGSVERNGSRVTLRDVYMSTTLTNPHGSSINYFYYRAGYTYGFKVYINGALIGEARDYFRQGRTLYAGTEFLHAGPYTWSFNLAPSQTEVPVRCVGTDGLAGDDSGGSLHFYLPPACDPPGTPSGSLSAAIKSGNEGATKATIRVTGVNYNCPACNGCSNSVSTVLSMNSSYSPAAYSGGSSIDANSLYSNTKYYVRSIISNGHRSTTKTASFTTLATGSAFGYKYRTDQVSSIQYSVDRGNDACATTAKLSIREVGGAWQQVDTTSAYGVKSVELRNKITRGKRYEAKVEVTNCAGTYTSTYSFAPPAADAIVGVITKLDSDLEGASHGQTAYVDYCYKVTSELLEPISASNPLTSRIQYRIKGQGEWQDGPTTVSNTSPATVCGTLDQLTCSAEYEFRIYMHAGSTTVYSATRTMNTATCADVYVCTCDNLHYMTELICQEVNRIKNGEKQIYANCETKELCDPYSSNPTWQSILSRVIRFDQAVACLICSMDALNFAAGEDDEVYTATEPGEYGVWQKLSQEMTEDDEKLISSKGAKDAIDEFIRSVWRPIGVYDYFAWKLEDLDTEAPHPTANQTAIVGNVKYKYQSGNWVQNGTVTKLAPFATVAIRSGTNYANHEFYWFANEWNLLDWNRSPEAERTKVLEDNEPKVVQTRPGETKYNIIVANINESNADIWNKITDKSRPTIVYLTDGVFVSNPFTLDVDTLDGGKRLI